ncbi:MAG: SGNH/GDSL hydrolase family protein [Pseudomonadota bacterium]
MTQTFRSAALAATALVTILAGSGAQASPVTGGLYVFGDSAAEQGNLYALPGLERPGTPYFAPDGFSRESNGPVWVEYLRPGIKPVLGALTSDAAVNFAYSGATSGVGNIAAAVETGLLRQVETYRQRLLDGAPRPMAGDLFVIETGTNDFIRDLGARDLRETSKEVTANVAGSASALARLGARRILVEEVPDFIRAPAFNDIVPAADRARLLEALDQLGAQHRAAQVAALAQANAAAGEGVDIVNVPINSLFRHIQANAKALGFEVVDRACYDEESGRLCSADPRVQNGYLFFDGLHLTTRAQELQAQYYGALLDQLDGRANLAAAALVGDGLALLRDTTSTERRERRRVWLRDEPAPAGLTMIAEAELARSRTGRAETALAARSETEAFRFGAGWSDGEGWSLRVTAAKVGRETRLDQGRQDLEGWTLAAAGERWIGPVRLGASAIRFWGDADGARRLPVALMSTAFAPKLRGKAADLEAAVFLQGGGFTAAPSVAIAWRQVSWRAWAETGDTGLEMGYGHSDFEVLDGLVGVAAAYDGWGRVRPRISLDYEHRLAGGMATLEGVLVGNSADPIIARARTSGRDRFVISPAVEIDLGHGWSAQLSSRHRVDARDDAVAAKVSLTF